MSYWKDVHIRNEQLIDRRKDAAHRRLIGEARANGTKRQPIYAQPMASIGHRLVAWGRRLEAQYGPVDPVPRDRHITPVSRRPGAIDHRAAPDQDIAVFHVSALLPAD